MEWMSIVLPLIVAIFGISMLLFIWWLHQTRVKLHHWGILDYNEEVSWTEFWKRRKILQRKL